ncbi:MAG: DUF3429 domain-containing protein [Hyphomicrobiales bacterium]
MSDRDQSSIPPAALWLGLAGAIPFWFAAFAFTTGRYVTPGQALSIAITYGAIILSFLGGIRWGTALTPIDEGRRAREFGLSVLPSLAGFAAFLTRPHLGVSLLIAGFLLQAFWDVTSVDLGRLPRWFGRLRVILTGLVCVPLMGILAGLLLR